MRFRMLSKKRNKKNAILAGMLIDKLISADTKLALAVTADIRSKMNSNDDLKKFIGDEALSPERSQSDYDMLLLKDIRRQIKTYLDNPPDHFGNDPDNIKIPIVFPGVRYAIGLEFRGGPKPPTLAKYFLFFLPKEVRTSMVGDLEEEFKLICSKFSLRKARFWYYWQVAASFWPLLINGIERIVRIISLLIPGKPAS